MLDAVNKQSAEKEKTKRKSIKEKDVRNSSNLNSD